LQTRYYLHTVFVFILLCAQALVGQIPTQPVRKVHVIDEDYSKVVIGILVVADFSPNGPIIEGKTDSFGNFYFTQNGAFKLFIPTREDNAYSRFEGLYNGAENEISVILKNTDIRTNPITVTATFGPRPVSKNPYIVQVITRDKIDKMGAQNLAEVLQNETSIQLGQDQVLGASAIMQGIGGQDIKILLNGIPVIGRVNGNIDVTQIPISNIEQVEIIQGPMSVVYGTDALGGVINIITRTPTGKKFTGRASVFIDNLSNYNFDGTLNSRIKQFKTKNYIPLSFNFGRYFFTGVDFDPATRALDWKPKTKYFADASAFIHNEKSTHRITSSFFTEKLTDWSNAEYNLTTTLGYNSFYYTSRFDNSIHSVFKINKTSRFEWQNAFNIYARAKTTIKRDLVSGFEKPYRPEDQDTTTFKYFNSRGIYSQYLETSKTNWIAGYDFVQDHGLGKRIPADNPGITDIALFGSFEYAPTKQWEIRPSLRTIYNSRFGNPIFESLFGNNLKIAPLIPSIQVKYNLSEHLSFRGSFSKGFRAPSLKELFFYFVDVNHNVHGNENLKAETSDNYILSFDYRHKLPAGMGTVFGFSLYNNIIKNKINLALSDARTNLYTYINIGRFRSQGLNINFEFFTRRFNWKFSSTFLNVVDLLEQADTFNQKYYINGQVTMNFSYKFPTQNLTVNLFSRYTSPTNGYTENKERYVIQGYYLMDFTAQKTFNKFKNVSLSAGVKNLLGITTVNSTRVINNNPHSQEGFNIFITPGRTVFLQINFNLSAGK